MRYARAEVTAIDSMIYAGELGNPCPVEDDIRLLESDITGTALVTKLVVAAVVLLEEAPLHDLPLRGTGIRFSCATG
jgi:dTDP-D-glucose 4,6-dehydratase